MRINIKQLLEDFQASDEQGAYATDAQETGLARSRWLVALRTAVRIAA